MNTTYDVVAQVAQALSQRIGDARYHLWFAGKTKLAHHDNQLTVGVPNLFVQDWLQKTFEADIREAAIETLGAAVTVRFVIDPELFQAARVRQANGPTTDGGGPPTEAPKPPMIRKRRWRLLEDFVVGPCNRVAHASAQSLIETPNECPIPLVFHGGVGTGKTHLLESLCSGLSRRNPEWRVVFLTAEDFTNRFVHAMHQHTLGSFRKQFRDCDALLIDDVGFLAKKHATQEEFLHTLDALQTAHRPVVLTTDCHPRLAENLMPELVDRLSGGAVWSLLTPERETRLGILRAKAFKAGGIPDEVLDFLADNLRGNVREIEAAVHSVIHLARVTGRRIDLEVAREAISDLLIHSFRTVSLDDVERVVCEVLGLSREMLFSKKRQWIYSYPRMLAMYLARKHTCATYSEVGKHFGNRNHSTVVAGEKRVQSWLKSNITLQLGKRIMPVADIVEQIERKLGE
ncbi:MAG: chromosomal replication initiator protein DnaA [Planctomycetes bacterium]|nr:chromosomal replication initiator protein DnaA [Planctomycetota bacterium]